MHGVYNVDRSDVIYLLTATRTKNKYGVSIDTYTKKMVYCQVSSVQQSEFHDAGRNGLNPVFRFTMFSGDYNNEEVVEYNGDTYSVYRTYLKRSDQIELYVERKGGSNGTQVQNQTG